MNWKEYAQAQRMLGFIEGVNVKTLDSWACERCRANWGKLAVIGIEKPPGLVIAEGK